MATVTGDRRAVLLRDVDNVAVAARPIPKGAVVAVGGRDVEVREPIPLGHKVALVDVEVGQPVRKYGQVIGFASRAILAGSWERRLPATERGNGTIAAAALAAGRGAQVHRLHDHEALDAIRVAGRIARMYG